MKKSIVLVYVMSLAVMLSGCVAPGGGVKRPTVKRTPPYYYIPKNVAKNPRPKPPKSNDKTKLPPKKEKNMDIDSDTQNIKGL